MKSGVIFLIYLAIIFVILYIYNLITSSGEKKNTFINIASILVISATISGILLLFQSKFGSKETFTFDLSSNIKKCQQDNSDKSQGCCGKGNTGPAGAGHEMTPSNWPYRPDQYTHGPSQSVPPIGSCDSTQSEPKNPYPPKYGELKDMGSGPDVNSKSNEGFDNIEELNAIKDAKIELYTRTNCPACIQTKEHFKKNGIEQYIEYKDVDENMEYLKSQGVSAIPYSRTQYGESYEGAINSVKELIEKLKIKEHYGGCGKDEPEDYDKSEEYDKSADPDKSDDTVHSDKPDQPDKPDKPDKPDIKVYGLTDMCSCTNKVKEFLEKNKQVFEFIPCNDNNHECKGEEISQYPTTIINGKTIVGFDEDKFNKTLGIAPENFVQQQVEQQVENYDIVGIRPEEFINLNGKFTEQFATQIDRFMPNYKGVSYHSKPGFNSGYYTYENYLPDSVKYGSMAGQLVPPGPCGKSQEGLR